MGLWGKLLTCTYGDPLTQDTFFYFHFGRQRDVVSQSTHSPTVNMSVSRRLLEDYRLWDERDLYSWWCGVRVGVCNVLYSVSITRLRFTALKIDARNTPLFQIVLQSKESVNPAGTRGSGIAFRLNQCLTKGNKCYCAKCSKSRCHSGRSNICYSGIKWTNSQTEKYVGLIKITVSASGWRHHFCFLVLFRLQLGSCQS